MALTILSFSILNTPFKTVFKISHSNEFLNSQNTGENFCKSFDQKFPIFAGIIKTQNLSGKLNFLAVVEKSKSFNKFNFFSNFIVENN